MTSSQQIPLADRSPQPGGFTLVEVLIATSLSAIILGGVLTSSVMIGRSSTVLANYTEMEGQARLGLEQFAQDVREAESITWISATEIRLTYRDTADVTYALLLDARGIWTFSRNGRVAIDRVLPESFSLIGYTIAGLEIPLAVEGTPEFAQATRDTKQLQISMRARRTGVNLPAATHTVISARFILRNKRVTI
jgi:prepilin-type N-terminal cleavage/methylation domain-containing protein